MVVISLKPDQWFMDRSGMAGSTRRVAHEIWKGSLPERDRAELVRELYAAENAGKQDPSGSQDMIGLVYPGVSRLDYDARVDEGRFPCTIESTCEASIARWLEQVCQLIPIAQRPAGYSPLGRQQLDAYWIRQLGQSGQDCFAAILRRNLGALGAAMNLCMRCWEAILPDTVAHPAIDLDLKGILAWHQARHPGAMYSGCGGGYLIVVSEENVPGAVRVRVRTED